jgi:ubiquinone/menaquinone biosynthesis C-methylase UbiE
VLSLKIKVIMENWTYNEFKHCGVDYSDMNQAAQYDKKHNRFRDYEKEVNYLINELSLHNSKNLTLIDLGCGTGAFAINASKYFKKIYAVDVAEAMIHQAKQKMDPHNTNITFINSGFLCYEHNGEPADIVITSAALHHLPDFWKQIALIRINKMLKLNGIFYLFDIVFQFESKDYKKKINDYITDFVAKAGDDFKSEVEIHIRDEFSTFDWIMKGLITNAGFKIEKSRSNDGFSTEYFCVKDHDI